MPNTTNREVSQLPPCDFRRSTGLLWRFHLDVWGENVASGWLNDSWNDYTKYPAFSQSIGSSRSHSPRLLLSPGRKHSEKACRRSAPAEL